MDLAATGEELIHALHRPLERRLLQPASRHAQSVRAIAGEGLVLVLMIVDGAGRDAGLAGGVGEAAIFGEALQELGAAGG